jgi:PAS domain S-box-containing protein
VDRIHSQLIQNGATLPAKWVLSALVLALISTIVVTGVFYFLNRQAKRQYLRLWLTAWIFYAMHLVAAIGLQVFPADWLLLVRRTCIGISGLLMFWGSFELTCQPRTLRELGLALVLVLTCCFTATYRVGNSIWLTVVMFGVLGSAGIYTGYIYLKRRATHHGATILGRGFVLWGSLLLLIPLLELSAQLTALSYLVSAGLAIMIAIAMATVLEREINVAEKSYRQLFDASSDAVFLVDMWKLKILEANSAAEDLTKYPVDTLVGMPFKKLCPSLSRDTGNVLQNQRAFNAVFRPYQDFYVAQDGGERVLCEGEAAIAEWRQRMVFQVNIRDVGEQRKLKEQIQRAEKLAALGQFVAGVAHELNNPLAVIMGNAQLLAGHDNLDERMKDGLGRIIRQSERSSRIIGELLLYSRPSPPKKAPIDLNRLVRDVLEWRRPACEAAEVSVRTRLAESLRPTQADRVQIEQVLSNLVGNAIDALKEHKLPRQIEVTTQAAGKWLRVAVRDNGPGIASEIREKIFNPFFTTKPIGRGTGLGLSLCNTYIHEHQGKIWVESEPGKGATFFVDLPLLDCAGKVPVDPDAPAVVRTAAAAPSGRRVLIIDDEPDIAGLLETILADASYKIKTASDGNEALQILSHETFDAILSDMRMPGLDGQALYQRLKQFNPGLAQRVIFVTGDTLNTKTREFLDATGNLWLSKPFRIQEVLDRVQKVVIPAEATNSAAEPVTAACVQDGG